MKSNRSKRFFIAALVVCSMAHLRAEQDDLDAYVEVVSSEENNLTFDDLAGIDEAIEELQDFVHFLKDPEQFTRLGARVPKGALLVGPPGTGKTSLARALAGQAGVSFISASGSEFDQSYVGVGAARVRQLFAQARNNAPCIIFIDEIDAVGMRRDPDARRGNEQTIHQLLAEMDGFVQNEEPILVLGSTNRVDILDPALIRPGRFDRIVDVPNPTFQGRLAILNIHARNKKLATDVDLEMLARGMSGFSGAHLENILNEAAIIATRRGAEEIAMHDIEEARDKELLGKVKCDMVLDAEEKEMTAYHEAGHTLVRVLNDQKDDSFHKVTIVPRGTALGVTHAIPTSDRYTQSKQELHHLICVALGGRAAEDLVFDQQLTGASSDLRTATAIARAMVCNYGMSQVLGLMTYDRGIHSDATIRNVEQEIQSILQDAYTKTKQLLQTNRDKLDILAAELLAQETLSSDQVYALFNMQKSAMSKEIV